MNLASLQKKVITAFQHNVEQGLEIGAGVVIFHQGKKILSLHAGCFDKAKTCAWEPSTLVTLYSAGKAVAATCLLHALQEKKISLETNVSTLWPEFAAAGKEKITILQILSHSSGLSALTTRGLSLTDHKGVAQALAAQAPNWSSDGTHGYGPLTFGFLVDEILRRVMDGEPLANYWRRVFGDPLGLDLWFGVPKKELARLTLSIPSKEPYPSDDFSIAFGTKSSLTYRSFTEPGGGTFMKKMSDPKMQQAPIISLGATSTTEALAQFYSLVATKKPNDFFTAATLKRMRTPVVQGMDRVTISETTCSSGFMMNATPPFMGPRKHVFGHLGTGGILAFADPNRELAFAYLCNLVHPNLPASIPLTTQRLVRALY